MSWFRKWFPVKVSAGGKRIPIEEYCKNRFVTVKTVTSTAGISTSVEHYNCYGEMFMEELSADFNKLFNEQTSHSRRQR